MICSSFYSSFYYFEYQIIEMIQNSKMNFRSMLLRPVGKQSRKSERCKKNMKFSNNIKRGTNIQEEEIELLSQADFLKDQKPQNQENEIFNLIEDPRESEFTYRKYVLLEKILLMLTVFYMLMCIIRTQILQNLNEEVAIEEDKNIIIIMNIISLGISILYSYLVVVILLRSICHNELKIDQKTIYYVRHKTGFISDMGRFFQKKPRILYFFTEVIFILVHPIIFFQQIKVKMLQPYDQVLLTQDLNDLLCLISLFRIYLVVRSLISITQYSTPRAVRLCSYNRIQHDVIYSIKCLLKEHPLLTIFTSFLIQLLVLGYGMRISEGTVQRENPYFPPTGFQNYINCFWCVFITMSTVGYGDYYPKSVGGRAVSFLAAISGIIVNSLLIVSLSAYLTMQTCETSSHLTLIRLQHQEKLKQQATEALIETMRLEEFLSHRNDKNKINNIFTTLKYKIDKVKYRSRKIKSLVNNNNIMEEMNRLFQILRQNIIEFYKTQLLLKQDLLNYEKTNSTKLYRKQMQTLMLTREIIKV